MTQNFLSWLEQQRPSQIYQPGEIIFHQGDEAKELFYLKTGLSLSYTVLDDGRERNLLVSWPGRLFGASTVFESSPRRASAVALHRCEVLRIDKELCRRCIEIFPEFSQYIIEELSKDIGILCEQTTDSSLLTADIKVARFIDRRVQRGQYKAEDQWPMLDYSQEVIARMLGLSRWSVNMALSKFRRLGWIKTGHGRLFVLDPDSLRRYGYGETE